MRPPIRPIRPVRPCVSLPEWWFMPVATCCMHMGLTSFFVIQFYSGISPDKKYFLAIWFFWLSWQRCIDNSVDNENIFQVKSIFFIRVPLRIVGITTLLSSTTIQLSSEVAITTTGFSEEKPLTDRKSRELYISGKQLSKGIGRHPQSGLEIDKSLGHRDNLLHLRGRTKNSRCKVYPMLQIS